MRENDNSLFVAYEENLKRFKRSIVKAGILASSGAETYKDEDMFKDTIDEITVFQVGMIHEFGVPEKNIPRRSFIRVPIENNIKEITKLIENNHRLVLEKGMQTKVALDLIGIKAQNVIKESFRNNNWKANSRATIKRKGSSRPLINTGQLIGSISYIVEKAEINIVEKEN